MLFPSTFASLKICEFIVVPIFAPIIIGIEFLSFKIPEFTSPTIRTVVVAELCVATVIKNPTSNPLNALSVTLVSICSSLLPDNFFSCVLSVFIP